MSSFLTALSPMRVPAQTEEFDEFLATDHCNLASRLGLSHLTMTKRGFTLLELVVVLLIIGMVVGIAFPRLDGGRLLRTKLDNSARAIESAMLLAQSRAVTTRHKHTFHIDLSSGEYWITSALPARRLSDVEDDQRVTPILCHRRLPSGIIFHEVLKPESNPINTGTASITFTPQGEAEDALIHVGEESGEIKSIAVRALDGSTQLLDGRVRDFDRE